MSALVFPVDGGGDMFPGIGSPRSHERGSGGVLGWYSYLLLRSQSSTSTRGVGLWLLSLLLSAWGVPALQCLSPIRSMSRMAAVGCSLPVKQRGWSVQGKRGSRARGGAELMHSKLAHRKHPAGSLQGHATSLVGARACSGL